MCPGGIDVAYDDIFVGGDADVEPEEDTVDDVVDDGAC